MVRTYFICLKHTNFLYFIFSSVPNASSSSTTSSSSNRDPNSGDASNSNQSGRSHLASTSSNQLNIIGLELDPKEEPLPEGWELGRTPSGKRFFINHNAKTTTWVGLFIE